MTLYEKELLDIIHSAPNKEYALIKALEIIISISMKEQPSTSREPSSACPREDP